MKKTLALVLAAVMMLALLAGCTDPVYDDLSNFLNGDMVEVNANYEKLKAEVGTWEGLADDAALVANIKDACLPLVNGSLAKLEAMAPATEEVKDIKTKYVKVMETYKAAFETLVEGCEKQDAEIAMAGYEKLGEAVDFLNEYNAALESLAKEHGGEIEY